MSIERDSYARERGGEGSRMSVVWKEGGRHGRVSEEHEVGEFDLRGERRGETFRSRTLFFIVDSVRKKEFKPHRPPPAGKFLRIPQLPKRKKEWLIGETCGDLILDPKEAQAVSFPSSRNSHLPPFPRCLSPPPRSRLRTRISLNRSEKRRSTRLGVHSLENLEWQER